MKSTLAAIAFLGLLGAWFYYMDNDELQAPDLTEIKRTAETLATTLKGNQQETAANDTTTEVAAQPDPALRHLSLKQRMLLLTNQEREKNGVTASTPWNQPSGPAPR